MPVQISWFNDEKTVVVYKFLGKWTWTDYHNAIREAYELVKDLSYTVNMVLDFEQSTVLPSNALSNFGASAKTPPRDFDFCVIVTSSRFIEAIVSMFRKVNRRMGQKLVLVRTLEEARAFFNRSEARVR
jgi:hypothetical protein